MKQIAIFLVVLLCSVGLIACSSSAEIILPDADEITKLGETCTALETMQIVAWQSLDIEQVRSVYTDDVVHFDGYPAYVGVDSVVNMAERILTFFADWQMGVGESYISDEGCVGTWLNWGIAEGQTSENPGREFDYLEVKNGKISFWRLFYDASFDAERIQQEFLDSYAEAWTSGDVNSIKDFYASNTTLEDSLMGVSISGKGNVGKYISSMMELGGDMEWEVLVPYGEESAPFPYDEEYPQPSTGGVFGIHVTDEAGKACMIEVFLMLTPDDDGKIIDHQMFYNEETLIECGWVK